MIKEYEIDGAFLSTNITKLNDVYRIVIAYDKDGYFPTYKATFKIEDNAIVYTDDKNNNKSFIDYVENYKMVEDTRFKSYIKHHDIINQVWQDIKDGLISKGKEKRKSTMRRRG